MPYRAIAERRLLDRLLQSNAVWPGSGQPLDGLRAIERRTLRRLVTSGVIREEGAGRYYLYAPAYAALKHSRRQRFVLALIFVVVAAMLVAVFGGRTAISF